MVVQREVSFVRWTSTLIVPQKTLWLSQKKNKDQLSLIQCFSTRNVPAHVSTQAKFMECSWKWMGYFSITKLVSPRYQSVILRRDLPLLKRARNRVINLLHEIFNWQKVTKTGAVHSFQSAAILSSAYLREICHIPFKIRWRKILVEVITRRKFALSASHRHHRFDSVTDAYRSMDDTAEIRYSIVATRKTACVLRYTWIHGQTATSFRRI